MDTLSLIPLILGVVFTWLCIMVPIHINAIARDIKAIRKNSDTVKWYAENDYKNKYNQQP